MEQHIPKYVLTGGPGVGKTTLLNHLQQKYPILKESAREIITEQSSRTNDPILPWTKYEQFQYLVLERQQQKESTITKPTILDRGIIDGVAYARHASLYLPDLESAAQKTTYAAIFILDQLPTYQNDSERREDPKLAFELHNIILHTYQEFGYSPITIPVGTIEFRAQCIENHIQKSYIQKYHLLPHTTTKSVVCP